MTKFKKLDSMLEQGNGYITTRAVTAQGISKPYFAEYARSRELERVAHGVYQSPDAWPDDMYILHLRNSNIVFSHQSALALHGMMEREPHHIYVTVKQGYYKEKGKSKKIVSPDKEKRFSDVRCQDFVVRPFLVGLFHARRKPHGTEHRHGRQNKRQPGRDI